MLATGGLLVSMALLAAVAVAPAFRSSNPPQWTTRGWLGEVVTIAIVCTLAIGLGYLGAGVIGMVQGPDYLDRGLLAVVLLVSVMVWRRLSARARASVSVADNGLHAHAPGSRRAHSHNFVGTAEGAPVSASEPVPPPPGGVDGHRPPSFKHLLAPGKPCAASD